MVLKKRLFIQNCIVINYKVFLSTHFGYPKADAGQFHLDLIMSLSPWEVSFFLRESSVMT